MSNEPSKKSKKVASSPGDRTDRKLARVRWFNPKPNHEDEEWLDAHENKLVELCMSLLDTIPDEGKLTVKYDAVSRRHTAILFVGSASNDYEMDALSVRGADAFSAVCLCAYFHIHKFEGIWAGDGGDGGGRWG